MLEVAEALAAVLEHARPRRPEAVPLSPVVLGWVLAAGATADRDSPPFDKSLRDGYAVRAADCAGGAELRVIEEVPAGSLPTKTLGAGECTRLFTGAPIPDGADAVVMQEDTQPLDGDRVRITDTAVKPGQWVFPRGREMRTGDVVLPAGTVLNAAAVGVLAGLGAANVPVVPWPRLAVLSTGNELVNFAEEPGPGQIRNSNGPMLVSLAVRAGAVVHDLGIARDTAGELRTRIEAGLERTDVLVLAGGVSVGKFDLVPGVLEELGVTPHVRQVRMKPGKPLFFGTRGDVLVFGLPGNPVSAFVCFELFVRPALRVLGGHGEPGPRTATLPLAEPVAESNDRPTYRPAVLEPAAGGWSVRPLPWAGAPDLRGLQPADALLVLPPGESRFDPGTPVPVVLLGC
jgi:molybdopterin molybdotransferase